MGKYREMKLEFFSGSPGPLKGYTIFLYIFAICLVGLMTWKVTVSGYEDSIYFLVDFLLCAFSIIAVLSLQGFDRATVFGNISFLLVWLGCKGYCAYLIFTAAPDTLAVQGQMGAEGLQGMEAAGSMAMNVGMGGMGGMGGMEDMAAQAVAAPPLPAGSGLIEWIGSKLVYGVFKVTGDYTKFFTIVALEVIGMFCLYFIFFFITNWKFFRTSLAKFREQAEAA